MTSQQYREVDWSVAEAALHTGSVRNTLVGQKVLLMCPCPSTHEKILVLELQ